MPGILQRRFLEAHFGPLFTSFLPSHSFNTPPPSSLFPLKHPPSLLLLSLSLLPCLCLCFSFLSLHTMKLSVGALFSSAKKSAKKKKSHSLTRSDTTSFGSNITTTTANLSSSEDSVTSSYSSSSSTRCYNDPKSVLISTPPRTTSVKSITGASDECWSSIPVYSPSTAPLSVSELFKIFDRDGDGKITKRELEEVLGGLGPDPPTEEELAAMLAEVDLDGDGCITLEEFRAVGCAFWPPAGAELRETFAVFDVDRDGKISAEELQGVFAALGDVACTIDDCRRMIGGVDSDGDGFVCFDDFVRMMG